MKSGECRGTELYSFDIRSAFPYNQDRLFFCVKKEEQSNEKEIPGYCIKRYLCTVTGSLRRLRICFDGIIFRGIIRSLIRGIDRIIISFISRFFSGRVQGSFQGRFLSGDFFQDSFVCIIIGFPGYGNGHDLYRGIARQGFRG